MRRLGIDSTPEMQKLIREREASHCPIGEFSRMHVFNFQRMTFLRLWKDSRGAFCTTLDDSEGHACFDSSEYLAFVGLTDSREECSSVDKDSRRPQKLYCGTQLIALISSEALPGDLVAFSPFQKLCECLVLRHSTGGNLDIVGTSFLLLKTLHLFRQQMSSGTIPSMTTSEMPKHGTFQAELHLLALPEDIMVFFHHNRREGIGVNLRRFLTIRPVDANKDAARIIPWRRGQESEAYWKLNEMRKNEQDRAELFALCRSMLFTREQYAHTGASLTVVYRYVEFTLRAARASLVLPKSFQIGQYDNSVDILVDIMHNGREAVTDARRALRQQVLEPFLDQLQALAPVQNKPKTLQEEANCVKYTLILGVLDGRIEVIEQPRGPPDNLRPLPRTMLDIQDGIPSIKADNIFRYSRVRSTAALEGNASLALGCRYAFYHLSENGMAAGVRRALSVYSKLSFYSEDVQRLRIPNLLGIITTLDDTAVLGILTQWVDAIVLASTSDVRRRKHVAVWKQEVGETLKFLHDRDIIWGGASAQNVLIDRDSHAWIMDFSGGTSTQAELEPDVENKQRELEAVKKLFEDRKNL